MYMFLLHWLGDLGCKGPFSGVARGQWIFWVKAPLPRSRNIEPDTLKLPFKTGMAYGTRQLGQVGPQDTGPL